MTDFNSHTREGVTFGAWFTYQHQQFQLTHPWGCDMFSTPWLCCPYNFNSHTREGVTPCTGHSLIDSIHFNSHTREGVTNTVGLIPRIKISTHTPVRVWLTDFFVVSDSWQFQLTHPWGCDHWVVILTSWHWISTHTPVRVWLCALSRTRTLLSFQLTHPWGCDYFGSIGATNIRFQLTHPWGCDIHFAFSDQITWEFQLTHPWGCD